jgi:hypothetical protein
VLRVALGFLCVIAASAALSACGSDDPEPRERAPETVDKLPKLPPEWHEYVNHRAGFAIGRPPGWRAKRRGQSTLLRSPDHLVAVSISADRTAEAVEFRLADYAAQAVEALPSFEELSSRKPHVFEARYEARAVSATGESKAGVPQRLLFVAMRRKDLVTYAVLVARNAEEKSGFYSREALRMVRTLRGRPIG